MNPQSTIPVAGPSNIRSSSGPSSFETPHIFLLPTVVPKSDPTHLSSAQDLLSRFHLLPAYDKYVRPFAIPVQHGNDQALSTCTSANGLDKGKGKELADIASTPGLVFGGAGDDDEGGTKGSKKKKKNYKHLIKAIPGKHSFRKDEYLSTIMQIPPKQRLPIQPFDTRTQKEAFSVSLDGLKGWNPSALILESPQAREDRKKRKELKRLQKLQLHNLSQGPVPSPVIQTPLASSAARVAPLPATSVQKQTSRSSTVVSRTIPSTVNPVVNPAVTAAGPGGMLSKPDSATTASPRAPASPVVSDKKGLKRERDDINSTFNSIAAVPIPVNGNGVANTSNMVVSARAGTSGVRPRPIKKQKMDIQGQARDMTTIQQPTPQGV